jgi:CHAT domain-containing protein
MKLTLSSFAIATFGLMSILTPVHAQIDPTSIRTEFQTAKQSIIEGRVRDGIGRLTTLLSKINPQTDPNDYWITSDVLADFLHQVESYSEESQVLTKLHSTNIANQNSPYFQRMQLNVGRNLAYTGHAIEAEKVLRVLTGGDARWVLNPNQRQAAQLLATIELDRGNISQAAIWVRRVLVGTLSDKGAGSEEIADVLTHYAVYLARMRRLPEAYNLLLRLVPTYENTFPHHSPKYLYFCGALLEVSRSSGNFQGTDLVYKNLKDNTASVDVVASSVRSQLFYQDLYGPAINSPASGDPALISRLNEISVQFPDYFKKSETRITFSYFAILAGNIQLAEQFATLPASDDALTSEFSAYKIILDAFFAARRNDFGGSIALVTKALESIEAFHQTFATESASRLPSISIEERLVLGTILGLVSPHISTHAEANIVFQLEQFLNRDKSKLSLSARVARQAIRSDLEKEDIRTRDRLKDLRERILTDATDKLIERTTPIKLYAPSQNNDYAFLTRLEDIEEKIANADIEIKGSVPDFLKRSNATSIDLTTVQQLLKPNEALIIHVPVVGQGFVSSCITSSDAVFTFERLSVSEIQQLVIDTKLVSAALRADYAPSIELDSTFPAESSYRLYHALLGSLDACLTNKTHLLLATDADFLTLPWNAFLTKLPNTDGPFKNRDAAWLPKLYSISLLPSVGSLRQLRTNLPTSQARLKFLGIGDPDFGAVPDRSTKASVEPLFDARGAANTDAIASLPRLPDAAAELRDIADVLNVPQSELLLGGEATERNLRSHPLNDYKIISFATHAIVAGELEGGTEPALILSPGADQKNTKNDGVLTANEIADLPLDANLVILSACNTAAPDGRIAGRGLSGLADAFFFAGARAVVVTQWSVFSDAARQLGTGLVSRSVVSNSIGVAEGLRQAMVDYVSNAKEDYLAHPRFWASYIIAGDGAVNPLGGDSVADDSGKSIQIDWENVSQRPEEAELMDITRTTFRGVNYAIGMKLPPRGQKRAGSYIAKIGAKGGMEIESRDTALAASRIISLDPDLGILGFYPVTCTSCPQSTGNTSAVFRLVDEKGRERWKYIQQSSQWIFANDMVRSGDGFILVAFATDYSSQSRPSSIALTQVSEAGVALKQNHYIIPLKNPVVTRGAIHGAKEEIIIAVTGAPDVSPSNKQSVWMNPATGTKRYQCSTDTSIILSIDPKTFEIRQRAVISNGKITRLKQIEGRVFASMSFTKNCQLEKNVRLVELDADFQPKTLFESNSINSLEISDFAVTEQNFLLVGTLFTFLPSALANATMSLDQLRNYKVPELWDESIWDNDSIGNAAVIVIGRDGQKRADRVFPDIRFRSLSTVAMRDPRHFVAVGSALGGLGWIVGIALKN